MSETTDETAAPAEEAAVDPSTDLPGDPPEVEYATDPGTGEVLIDSGAAVPGPIKIDPDSGQPQVANPPGPAAEETLAEAESGETTPEEEGAPAYAPPPAPTRSTPGRTPG